MCDMFGGLAFGAGAAGDAAATDVAGGGEKIGFRADGMDARDRDIRRLQFNPQRFGERKLGGFGGGVSAEKGEASAGGTAGDDDQLATEAIAWFLLQHQRDGGMDAVQSAKNIGGEYRARFFGGGFESAADQAVAGVANQRIDAAELGVGFNDERLAIIRATDVGTDHQVFPAELLIEIFEQIDTSRGQNQSRTGGGKLLGQCAANAGAGSSNHHGHILKCSCHAPIVSHSCLTTDDRQLTTDNLKMFTGIVEKTVRVAAVADGPAFRRLTLALGNDVQLGESIAVNGVCLTVAEKLHEHAVGFDVIKETLEKTNLGMLTTGDEVNIERSLRAGDRISGHFVQGHVDGTAALVNQIVGANETRLTLQCPDDLLAYLAPKGSITLDGVSLTIAAIRGAEFDVALIPTTLQMTTIGRKSIGYMFNVEADIIGKTVVSYLQQRGL
jgi:riboflavin synthase